ncbi:MAG: histidine kinase [Ginsengibacter sp.]
MSLFRLKYFTPGIHFLIWIVLLGIPTLIFGNRTFLGLQRNFFFITNICHIGLFYLNALFLYPRLLTKKRWPLYILTLAAIVAFSYYAKLYLLKLNPAFHLTTENNQVIFFAIIPFIIASIIFRLVSNRIRFEKLEKESKAEQLASELKFLRLQVSPHFLFNMMTNMVSLGRQKSDLLEPSLIRLSELLRYMLYDSAEETIPISKETEQLENYVSLQQLRFGEDVKVELEIQNNCPDSLIEPMLLVPFIENAFKHGVGMIKDPYIKIQLLVKDQVLNFKVTNSYNAANLSKDKNSGIGLMNVKNRLELLYSQKYKLDIADANQIFSVHLNLVLS